MPGEYESTSRINATIHATQHFQRITHKMDRIFN